MLRCSRDAYTVTIGLDAGLAYARSMWPIPAEFGSLKAAEPQDTDSTSFRLLVALSGPVEAAELQLNLLGPVRKRVGTCIIVIEE